MQRRRGGLPKALIPASRGRCSPGRAERALQDLAGGHHRRIMEAKLLWPRNVEEATIYPLRSEATGVPVNARRPTTGGLAEIRAQGRSRQHPSGMWSASMIADAVKACDEGLLEPIDIEALPPGHDGTPALRFRSVSAHSLPWPSNTTPPRRYRLGVRRNRSSIANGPLAPDRRSRLPRWEVQIRTLEHAPAYRMGVTVGKEQELPQPAKSKDDGFHRRKSSAPPMSPSPISDRFAPGIGIPNAAGDRPCPIRPRPIPCPARYAGMSLLPARNPSSS